METPVPFPQNKNFNPNCRMRGLCAPPGRMKLLFARQLASPALKSDPPKQLVPVLTPFHCVWLNTLKAFGAELDGPFLLDFKMLEQAHVEVGTRRVLHDIALRCPEGQPFRRGKCRRIEEQRTVDALNTGPNIRSRVGIADDVQIGTRSRAVAYAGVEKSIAETERSAGLKGCKSGKLPAAQQRVRQAFLSEEGHVVNVADIQDMALIEIRAGPSAAQIVGIDEVSIVAIRRIVQRMAIGVCQIEIQPAHVTADRNLQRVVA